MKFRPLLLSILVTVICIAGAGCSVSSSSPEQRDTSLQITPKPYIDEEYKEPAATAGSRTSASSSTSNTSRGTAGVSTPGAATAGALAGDDDFPFSGTAYGLSWNNNGGWTQEEINAASFIHSATVYFHFDSATLTETAMRVLRQKAAKLNIFPQFYMVIAGHGDERGTNEYNMALGERRAQAVYKYLLTLGVPATQMSTISYGKMYPVDTGASEEAMSRNRRVEFFISK